MYLLKACLIKFLILVLFFPSYSFSNSEKSSAQLNNQLVELTAKEVQWLKKHPKVIAGSRSDLAPFSFVDKNKKIKGILNDYLELIGTKTGLNFVIKIDSWKSILNQLKNTDIDVVAGVYYTEERAKSYLYSPPFFEVLDYFFIRNDIDAKSIDDLNGFRVAIPKSFAHKKQIEKYFPKIKVINVNGFGEAIDAVLEGRAELLFSTYAILKYALEKEGIDSIVPFRSVRKEIGISSVHIVSRNNAPELASIIKKGLSVISEKEKRDIYLRWLGEDNLQKPLVLTGEERLWLNEHREIKWGIESSWPPYEFVDKFSVPQGFSIDVIRLIEKKLGIDFVVHFSSPWVESLNNIKNQKMDLIGSIVKTPERSKYILFSTPYFNPSIAIFMRKESSPAINISDLDGKTVAIEEQYFLHEILENQYPQIKLRPVKNTFEALKLVSEGEVDAHIGNQGAANWVVEKNGFTNLKITHVLSEVSKNPFRLSVRKDWPIFQGLLNKALASIPETEISSIRRKWLGLESNAGNFWLSPEEQLWLNKHKTIRFTGDPNWLPYEAFDDKGEYIGIVAEHLRIIEKKLGIKFKIIPSKSWRESIEKVKSGDIDILSETTDSDLKSHLNFTQAYISSPVVIVMKQNENYVESIDKIQQKRIAIIKDYGYVPRILKKHPNLDFEMVSNIQDGLTAVSTGKVDALLANLAQSSYHISKLGINNIRIVGKTEFETKLAFGMSKDFHYLIPLFNRALEDISPNEKKNIFDKWGDHRFVERTNYTFLILVILIFLGIIFIAFYSNRKLSKEVNRRKEAELQTQTLIDRVPLQIIVTTREGEIVLANPKALKDYGLSLNKLPDENISIFYENTADYEMVRKKLNHYGKIEQIIIPFKKFDGSVRSMMVSITPIMFDKRKSFLTIAVDLTERLEIEADLQKAIVNAESANRAKSEFLSNMSHEIRTPMNAIIGFTELLNEQLTEPRLKSFVNTIQSAGKNLLVLIDDILDLSKIEAGKLTTVIAPCNAHELFYEIGNIFMMKMHKKGIDFVFDVDPSIPESLQLDAVRLRQVLFNLIGNAVKFTDHGSIKVIARVENKDEIHRKIDLLIDVKDSGVGIAKDQQEAIFRDFEQADGQDSRKYGGTGLGLAISKRLVKMMGGEIGLESTEGCGTCFTIKLFNVDVSSIVVESIKETFNEEVTFDPSTILVVDDIEDNRQLLQESFSNTNLKVIMAENGLEAVNLMKKKEVSIILMDIRMPVMDGYQAAKEIKCFSDVPIVALTASVMNDEFELKKSNDFDGYLRKPVLKKELIKTLCQFLPYTQSEVIKQNKPPVDLTTAELLHLPHLLMGLNNLQKQYDMLLTNNNLSEIKKFSCAVTDVEKQAPIKIVKDFVTNLNFSVDTFNINEIETILKSYPKLIEALELLHKK